MKTHTETTSIVRVIAASMNPDATLRLTVRTPDGDTIELSRLEIEQVELSHEADIIEADFDGRFGEEPGRHAIQLHRHTRVRLDGELKLNAEGAYYRATPRSGR